MYFRFPLILVFVLAGSIGLMALQSKLGKDSPQQQENSSQLASHVLEAAHVPPVSPEMVPVVESDKMMSKSKARQTIRPVDLRAHLEFLADDLLEGRDTGSRGARIAANYIATHFQRLGLAAGGDNGSFFQAVHLKRKRVQASSQMKVEINGEMVPLVYGKDFLIAGQPDVSGEKLEFESLFAGFGIQAEKYDYDDYRDLDVTGKAVVYVSGEPKSDDETYFDGKKRTRHASSRAKSRVARAAGAGAAICIFREEQLARFSWGDLQSYLLKPQVTLRDSGSKSKSNNFPSVFLQPDAAELLFVDENQAFSDVSQQASDGAVQSFAMKKKVELSIDFLDEAFTDNNVAGFLEGSDPILKSEIIVITAHYDHIGLGTPVAGDSLYNGAADNASGVAGLLELAEAFASLPEPPRRSLLFLAVTAEEKGLLGSRYYVEHPIYPLEKTVANFNLDMIGIGDTTAMVVYGIDRNTLGNNIRSAAEKIGVTIYPDDMPEQRVFYRSDHYNFALKGIPVVFPSFGIKKEGMVEFEKFYHKPSDDINLFWLNYNHMQRHVQVVFEATLGVANADESPAWNPDDEFANVRNKAD